MTRVLVTGATGFVGRNALEPLVARGYEVHAVSSRGPVEGAPAATRWHAADLLDDAARRALVAEVRPDELLHFAWYAEPGAFWRSDQNLRWVAATLGLLRDLADHGGRRAVLAGTCAEYAWDARTHCVEGSTSLAPATLYGASKHGLRIVAEAFAAERGLALGWGRIFFLFGPHEDPRRLASSVAQRLVRGDRAETSSGEHLRDFLYAPDCADAFVAFLASGVTGAVNVASGEAIPMRRLVELIGEAAGRPDLLDIGARPSAASEPEVLSADATRLRDEVGWSPPGALEERVERTVRWWSAQTG